MEHEEQAPVPVGAPVVTLERLLEAKRVMRGCAALTSDARSTRQPLERAAAPPAAGLENRSA